MRYDRHGASHTPTYKSWQAMKDRCTNEMCNSYENYGGRGITFDPRWHDFVNFYIDMGERPEGCVLDRIDNEKGYYKENCQWLLELESGWNRRSNKMTRRKATLVRALLRSVSPNAYPPSARQTIADVFGVSRSTIYHIEMGRIWK